MLAQSLAEPLRDAALDLSFDNHWIDHGADVVHAPVAEDVDFAGVAIDLELASVRAVAPGEVARVVERAVLQAEFQIARIIGRMMGDAGNLAEGHAAVGSRDAEQTVSAGDVA